MSKNIQGKTRDGSLWQIIWGCFLGNKLGPIAFIDGMMNKDVYINILRDQLVSFFDVLEADGRTNITFQQNNAQSTPLIKQEKYSSNWLQNRDFQ